MVVHLAPLAVKEQTQQHVVALFKSPRVSGHVAIPGGQPVITPPGFQGPTVTQLPVRSLPRHVNAKSRLCTVPQARHLQQDISCQAPHGLRQVPVLEAVDADAQASPSPIPPPPLGRRGVASHSRLATRHTGIVRAARFWSVGVLLEVPHIPRLVRGRRGPGSTEQGVYGSCYHAITHEQGAKIDMLAVIFVQHTRLTNMDRGHEKTSSTSAVDGRTSNAAVGSSSSAERPASEPRSWSLEGGLERSGRSLSEPCAGPGLSPTTASAQRKRATTGVTDRQCLLRTGGRHPRTSTESGGRPTSSNASLCDGENRKATLTTGCGREGLHARDCRETERALLLALAALASSASPGSRFPPGSAHSPG